MWSASNRQQAWQLMGMAPTNSCENVRSKYKKAALKHHPDKPGGDTERFKEVRRLYDLATGTCRPAAQAVAAGAAAAAAAGAAAAGAAQPPRPRCRGLGLGRVRCTGSGPFVASAFAGGRYGPRYTSPNPLGAYCRKYCKACAGGRPRRRRWQ